MYRQQLRLLGLPDGTVEVTGWLCGGLDTKEPTVHVYLPDDFDLLVEAGFHEDPANNPAWLRDGRPVGKRLDGSDYAPDELRKIYVWAARREHWGYLPERIERHVSRWQGEPGVHMTVALKLFASRTR